MGNQVISTVSATSQSVSAPPFELSFLVDGKTPTNVYELVPSGIPGDTSRLMTGNLQDSLRMSGSDANQDFSICIWFNLQSTASRTCLMSYATSDTLTSVLQLDVESNRLLFVTNYAITKSYEVFYEFQPLTWYHTCLVLQKTTDSVLRAEFYSISLYFDGTLKTVMEGISLFPLSGTLVFGQEQEKLGSQFNLGSSFLGKASMACFSEALDPNDVEVLSQCQSPGKQMVDVWQTYGQVNIVPMDDCRAIVQQPTVVELTSTATECTLQDFTCDSGQCVPAEKKCNAERDCADGSDERSCSSSLSLSLPAGYQKSTQPPQRPLQMRADVSVAQVSVNPNSESVQMVTAVKMYWKDSRLTFPHLDSDVTKNDLAVLLRDIWLPHIKVRNGRSSSISAETEASLLAMRDSTGSDSTLVYQFEQSNHITCKSRMEKYPFDDNTCSIEMMVDNVPEDTVELKGNVAAGNEYLRLADYDVSVTNVNTKGNVLTAGITMQRIAQFHFTSSYLPVIFIHLLAYGTLYIKPSDFKSRAGMSVLLLLVLAVKYSDSMSNSPRRSYLTYLDGWYTFSFVFVFLIIVVHLVTRNSDEAVIKISEEDKKLRKVAPLTSKGKTFPTLFIAEGDNDDDPKLKSKVSPSFECDGVFILFVAKIAFAILYVLFHLSYWIAVAV